MMPSALIVEDEPAANRLLARLIQLRGFETESAYTGGEALEKIRDNPPDIVFLDLMLPDINGYEICETLKTRRETNPIPVVIVTARVAAENQVQSYLVGANDYIPKPYTPDQIFDALNSAQSWRDDLRHHPDHGEIVLRTQVDSAAFDQVLRFWSLLLARTPLDEQEVRRLGLALLEWSLNLIAWGECQGKTRLARIGYQIAPDRVVLTFQDEAGWSACRDFPEKQALGLVTRSIPFDEVARDESTGSFVLTRCFPAP